MLKKFILLSSIMMYCIIIIGCEKKSATIEVKNIPSTTVNENSSVSKNLDDENTKYTPTSPKKAEVTIIPTNTADPFNGRKVLDSETEKSFLGTWKVEKLLGFANSYNDASEYPTGQKIIDDEIIINKDFFSSKGLENYNDYQCELENPFYEIKDNFIDADSFYRVYKTDLSSINIKDKVIVLHVSPSSTEPPIPLSFFVVNNDRLLLVIEATVFELNKVTD